MNGLRKTISFVVSLVIFVGCANWGIRDQPLVQEGFPVWNKPVVVYAEPVYKEATKDAVKFMNNSIGCEVFSYFNSKNTQINVMVEQKTDLTSAGRANIWVWNSNKNSILDATVQVKRVPLYGDQFYMIAHELGHVLGLLHDPYGLMKPRVQTELELTSQPIRFPRMNDGDRKYLKEKYCE